jgi:hypothetical protein
MISRARIKNHAYCAQCPANYTRYAGRQAKRLSNLCYAIPAYRSHTLHSAHSSQGADVCYVTFSLGVRYVRMAVRDVTGDKMMSKGREGKG